MVWDFLSFATKRQPKHRNWILFIEERNDAITTYYFYAKIVNNRADSKCRLCVDRVERVCLIISRCKKNTSRHNRAGKVIHWKLCKRLKFDHADKWWIHKPESVIKYGMHIFGGGVNEQIHKTWSDLMLIYEKKTNYHPMDFDISAERRKKWKWKDRQKLKSHVTNSTIFDTVKYCYIIKELIFFLILIIFH